MKIPKISNKQAELLKALQSREYQFFLYGGGMGGGKSYLLALIFLGLATNYPDTRYAIFRKNRTVLTRTTYLTFIEVANDMRLQYKENRQELFWEFHNGSRIYFVELDETKDSQFNKVKGFNLTAAGIDEANEVSEAGFNILMGRIGRQNRNDEHPFILMTCNPDLNWVKTRFYDPWRNDTLDKPYFFLPALPHDNPFLPQSYLETLEFLPEAEYKRYVQGDWDYSDDPNQLIKYEWIKKALVEPEDKATYLGIDIAREGDDRSVLSFVHENTITRIEEFKGKDTAEMGDIAIMRMREYNISANNVYIDAIGLGAGTIDYLKSQGLRVNEYKASNKPTRDAKPFTFRNYRAQSYWGLREGIKDGDISLLKHDKLIQELVSIRYQVTEKQIEIESKQAIKKRLGSSPDIADAAVISFTRGGSGILEYYKNYGTNEKENQQSFINFIKSNNGRTLEPR